MGNATHPANTEILSQRPRTNIAAAEAARPIQQHRGRISYIMRRAQIRPLTANGQHTATDSYNRAIPDLASALKQIRPQQSSGARLPIHVINGGQILPNSNF